MAQRRRPVESRRGDFDDMLLPYTDAQARWEASRCLGCHDAPCNGGCPVGIDVRSLLRHLQLGDPRAAADSLRRTNVLAWSCSRVCYANAACMLRCARADLDSAIDIPGLEGYAIEKAGRSGLRPLPVGPVSGKTVAVLGAGPAGLAAAAELRRLGHQVVLYDAREEPGGNLVWAIPPHRLPRDLVSKEIQSILDTGIELRLGHPFDTVGSLRETFDAVVLAVGLGLSARLGVDGEDLGGVFPASALLDGSVDDVGPRPFVIGGGNLAVDAASTAVRLAGPKGHVSILYRRARQHMPGNPAALEAAIEEGVVLRPLTVVERILGDPDGNVALLRARSVDLDEPDETGRPKPVELSGATFDLPATSVIVAVGVAADLDFLVGSGLPDTEPRADESGRTDVTGLYLAGDAIGRGKSVAWAVSTGVRAARAVDEDLEREKGSDGPFPVLGHGADLTTSFAGKTLPNPFILSASPVTDGLAMAQAGLAAGFGGVVLKTTALEGTPVAPKHPSVQPIAQGSRLVAALGNIDLISVYNVDAVAEWVASLKEDFPDRLVAASVMSDHRDGWQKVASRLAEAKVDLIECSVSCPQGSFSSKPGAMVGQNAKLVQTVTKWVKDAVPDVPVLVKITPQVVDISEVAQAVAEAGGDGITAANTVPGLAGVDVEAGEPLPSVGGSTSFSGISGPAVLPVSLKAVAESARQEGLAVSGSGGVETWRDAVAMMMVGASTVQLCTTVMHRGLDVLDALCDGLASFMERHEIEHVSDLVGRALEQIKLQDELTQPGAVRAKVDPATCIGCGRCYVSCRDGAYRAIDWDGVSRTPDVSLERCIGCGLCAGVCPTESISYMILGT